MERTTELFWGVLVVGVFAGASFLSPAPVAAANSKVVICHIPPGDPDAAHTITVSEKAVQAHLKHGDWLGECASGCLNDAECDDQNLCTDDECLPDGDCSNEPVDCDDSNVCTEDLCEPANGCINPPVSVTTDCDDNNVCTGGDTCEAGICTGTDILGCCLDQSECDDGDWCTDDACVGNVCKHSDVDCSIPDDACFVGSCDSLASMCVAIEVSCDDLDVCTDDFCDSETGCYNPPTTNPPEPGIELTCDDELDNDCDGDTDGDDSDCGGECYGLPQGTVCRPPAGPCDIAELCDGSSPQCPPDALAPEGTPCLGEGTCQDLNYWVHAVCVGAGTCLGDEPGLVFNGIDYAACLARGECESPASLAHQCAADVLDRTSCEDPLHLEQLTNMCGAALTVAENCDACMWTGLTEDCALCVLDLEYLINDGKNCGTFSAYSMAECTAACVPSDEICDGQDNDCDASVDEDGDYLCSDGDLCTTDSCHGTGGCLYEPVTCNLGETCDPQTGSCVPTEVTCPCWDGSAGSAGDSLEQLWLALTDDCDPSLDQCTDTLPPPRVWRVHNGRVRQ